MGPPSTTSSGPAVSRVFPSASASASSARSPNRVRTPLVLASTSTPSSPTFLAIASKTSSPPKLSSNKQTKQKETNYPPFSFSFPNKNKNTFYRTTTTKNKFLICIFSRTKKICYILYICLIFYFVSSHFAHAHAHPTRGKAHNAIFHVFYCVYLSLYENEQRTKQFVCF